MEKITTFMADLGNETRAMVPVYKIYAKDSWAQEHLELLATMHQCEIKHWTVPVRPLEGHFLDIYQVTKEIAKIASAHPDAKMYVDIHSITNIAMLVVIIPSNRHFIMKQRELSKIIDVTGREITIPATTDRYRKTIVDKLDAQITKGVRTYGQLLQDNNKLGFNERLDYLQEELIDGMQYIEFIREKKEKSDQSVREAVLATKDLCKIMLDVIGSADQGKLGEIGFTNNIKGTIHVIEDLMGIVEEEIQ